MKYLEKYPQIIILSEIWIKDNEIDLYQIPNTLFYKCNTSNKSGGVTGYIHNNIKCTNITVTAETANYIQLCLNLDIFI